MVDSIRTFTGVLFTPLSPNREDINITDIAHALSLMTRANGHFPHFYSVAQHCIACCNEALARNYSTRVALACLLHDASEAYMSDITRPLKKHLDFYIQAEDKLLEAIYSTFLEEPLTDQERKLIKLIDDTMLYYEFLHFMQCKLFECTDELFSQPDFKFVEFSIIEEKFKKKFKKLKKCDKELELEKVY
jgi:5'-deoxynucleotidase YfbR-like HD superfamily hydrolase